MLSTLSEFIGHFHPVLVHLPIGILLLGLMLKALSGREKYDYLNQAVPLILLLGTVTALLSAVTGYLLSISDDYDRRLVGWHQWMGIGVVVTSGLLYARERNWRLPVPSNALSILLFLLILITGHLGGSLTHGSDFITGPLNRIFTPDSGSPTTIEPLPNVQEALVFQDVIQPILQTKCYACHGASKQKGGLRMDDSIALIKGGKDGKVIKPHNADASDLIRRLTLPVDDEDHMPPKEKPQPTESQIALIRWWIGEGAGFTKKVRELAQTERLKPILAGLEEVPEPEKESALVPATVVEIAEPRVIEQLRQKGILVLPISRNTNYLMANLVMNTSITEEDIRLLPSLKKQLLWLKLGYTNITDKDMPLLGQLTGLTRLSLEHTAITDEGLKHLQSLENLQYLNLVGTKVTSNGVLQLKELKSLRTLYLYQIPMVESEWESIKATFPNVRVERGGYIVPTTTSDTTVVEPK